MDITRRGIIVHTDELNEEWLSWMADAGLNTLGLHPVGGVNAHESLQKAIDSHTLPESRRLRSLAASHGIRMEYEAHTMSWLLPRHLFSRHPEWFRMNEEGERTPNLNLCVSNPDALEYVAERTALLASLLDTGVNDYFFWLDDARNSACHCPACQKLSASDQQLIAVNAMLSGLKRYNRNARLCFIAYLDTMEPPKKTEPLDGVFLEYAPISRDHHRPLNDPDSEKNRSETRTLPDLLRFFGKDNARVLDYWMDNSLFSGWKKPPKPFALDEEVMKRDVEYYSSLGFQTITCFGCYLGPDYQQLYGHPPVEAYGRILRG